MPLLLKESIYSKAERPHIDRILGRYKGEEFIRLVERWTDDLEAKKVLKTDLCEEAFGEDQILFSSPFKNITVFAIDISEIAVKKAHLRQKQSGFDQKYIRADVRNLPFCSNVFNFIVSTSTLDHFNNKDDLTKALLELKRVLKPRGCIIIAFNNKYNINFYTVLKVGRFLKLISYPVQFYTSVELKKTFNNIGLSVQDEDFIVNIISPINTILLLLERFISRIFAKGISKKSVVLSEWLSSKIKTKFRTAWFIVFKLVKVDEKDF